MTQIIGTCEDSRFDSNSNRTIRFDSKVTGWFEIFESAVPPSYHKPRSYSTKKNVNSCTAVIEIYFMFMIFTCVSYAEARNRYRLDVRLSVCLSVTRWHCIKTAEYFVMLFSPHDSPFILVLCLSRSSRNSDGVTPCGALNAGGV